MGKHWTIIPACIGLLLTGQAFSDAPSAYLAGVDAFRSGHYETALERFEEARAQGDRRHKLTYNLAVTHYQLGQLRESEELFRRLAREREWADLARYNLGLIATRRGERDQAVALFTRVAEDADEASLRALARERLAEFGATAPPRALPESAGFGIVTVAGGFDGNALAFPDALQGAGTAGGEDAFLELLAYGQYDPGAFRVHGYGYTRRYSDIDFLDATSYAFGLDRGHRLAADWRLRYGLTYGSTSVDGDTVVSDLQMPISATRSAGANEFRVGIRPAFHSGGTGYEYLDGSGHRLEARFRHRAGRGRFTVGYRFEIHDREDRTSDTEFFSYSPTVHRLLAEFDWYAGPAWTLTAGGSFASSRFRGVNEFIDLDDQVKQARRSSDRGEAWIKAQYRLTKALRLNAEVKHTTQSDTFLFYEFDRTVATVGLQVIL